MLFYSFSLFLYDCKVVLGYSGGWELRHMCMDEDCTKSSSWSDCVSVCLVCGMGTVFVGCVCLQGELDKNRSLM